MGSERKDVGTKQCLTEGSLLGAESEGHQSQAVCRPSGQFEANSGNGDEDGGDEVWAPGALSEKH